VKQNRERLQIGANRPGSLGVAAPKGVHEEGASIAGSVMVGAAPATTAPAVESGAGAWLPPPWATSATGSWGPHLW
jgi:hypothetical protein